MGTPCGNREADMFLSMDILASDLAQFDSSVHIADADASRGIRYVTPAGSLMLDDPSALYAMPASQLARCTSRATKATNVLCIGNPDDASMRACDMLNVLSLDVDEAKFDEVLKSCAEAIAWYADGFTRLTEAAEKGDQAAMRRVTALLQYCADREGAQSADPNALAEQLDLLLHRNITSWQLLEDTIADWGWDLLDEYLCVTVAAPDRSARLLLPTLQVEASDASPTRVCLPQEEYLVVVMNLTRSSSDYREAATDIAVQLHKFSRDAPVGASNPFSELQDLYYYGQQAKSALQIGSALGVDEPVSFFHDRFLDYVALRCLEACPPTTLFPPGYSRLRNYEHTHPRSGSLVRFLHAYIENDFQMKPTVAAEFCSRTTAFEKLRKIKQISGMDLDDPNTRAALRLATHAIRLSKISPSQPG